jgi:tripartite-type tricarboxylate transporter receptor subunit TctC
MNFRSTRTVSRRTAGLRAALFAAGGAVDRVARTVGQKVSASVGQPVIVENGPGAGSKIAIRAN